MIMRAGNHIDSNVDLLVIKEFIIMNILITECIDGDYLKTLLLYDENAATLRLLINEGQILIHQEDLPQQ